jgi:hypothetical protein
MQDCQRATIAISARATDCERASVQKLYQPTACTQRQISLRGTLSVQLRRIDVGDADFLAFDPNRVAIVDAVVARTGCANGEGGNGKDQHLNGIATKPPFSYSEQMWNKL